MNNTDKRDVPPSQVVTSSCIILVFHRGDFYSLPSNSLKPALKSMLEQGLASDLRLHIGQRCIPVHKCIVSVRSARLRELIDTNGGYACTDITIEDVKGPLFERLLKWIYAGDIEIPEQVFDVIELSKYAEEFGLPDLRRRCEEDMLTKVTPSNVVELLVLLARDGLPKEPPESLQKSQKVANAEKAEGGEGAGAGTGEGELVSLPGEKKIADLAGLKENVAPAR